MRDLYKAFGPGGKKDLTPVDPVRHKKVRNPPNAVDHERRANKQHEPDASAQGLHHKEFSAFIDLLKIILKSKPHGQWFAVPVGGPPLHRADGFFYSLVEPIAGPASDLGAGNLPRCIEVDCDLDRSRDAVEICLGR